MNLLLDTHVFLWWATAPDRLSPTARTACEDGGNVLLLSITSVWEIQIKLQIGKLTLAKPLSQLVQNQVQVNHLRLLPIKPAHIYGLEQLPLYHKDPFDRLIVAQALIEQITVVSGDRNFGAYPVALLW